MFSLDLKQHPMNIADSLRSSLSQPLSEPRDRAKELYKETLGRFELRNHELKPGESLDLLCSVGGHTFNVHTIGYVSPDFMSIESRTPEGDELSTIAPVEQVAFTIVLSERHAEKPKPQIGFAGATTIHDVQV